MFNEDSCQICYDRISDPVCGRCYQKQTKILLEDLKIQKIKNEFIIKKIKIFFLKENLNDTDCILCMKEKVDTCSHCFSNKLTKILEESKIDEKTIENFCYTQKH